MGYLAEQRHLMGIEPAFEGVPGFRGPSKRNVATVKGDVARKYAEGVFARKGDKLDDLLPDFDENYRKLQRLVKAAPDIPRLQMPVIDPDDMQQFHKALQKGRIDIFKPHAKGIGKFLGANWAKMKPDEGASWVTLGLKDGKKEDDVVKAQWTTIAASKLKPVQGQIWLEILIQNIAQFGVPKAGGFVTKSTIIVSKEGFILDGHHRFGQVTLADPGIKMKVLKIPLDIKTLLKVGRSYGAAVGHSPNA